MPNCSVCGADVPSASNFCPQCAAPVQSSPNNIELTDSVIGGDIHQTNITNIHQHSSRKKTYFEDEEIRIDWAGLISITKMQFFVVYFASVSITLACMIAGVPFFRKWLFVFFLGFVAFTINAVDMRERFRSAERQKFLDNL